MVIGRVQDELESVYETRCEMRAEKFVVQDRDTARSLGARGHADEELLVLEEDGELDVALFLAPELLARLSGLASAGNDSHLDDALDSYCQVVEGVSHFLYLAQVRDTERTVSLLELETQAEVDKFALCVLARWKEGAPWAKHIHGQLFDRFSLRAGMDDEEQHRYQHANRLARGYCGRLLKHVEGRDLERLLSALRYSFRLGAEAKLRHLAQAA